VRHATGRAEATKAARSNEAAGLMVIVPIYSKRPAVKLPFI
jgi:hypothetical protein